MANCLVLVGSQTRRSNRESKVIKIDFDSTSFLRYFLQNRSFFIRPGFELGDHGHQRRLGTPATIKTHYKPRWASEAMHQRSVEEKAPSCETFPLDEGTRDEATPAYLKKFLHEIAPEQQGSSPDDLKHPDHLFQRHVNRGHLFERIRLSDSTTGQAGGRSSRRGSMAGNADIQKIDEEGDEVQGPPPQHQQQHKFTEMEIVTLWNRFKFDFPTGNINEKQLLQLFRQVTEFF